MTLLLSGLLPIFILAIGLAHQVTNIMGVSLDFALPFIFLAFGNLAIAYSLAFGAIVQMSEKPWLYPTCIWACLAATAAAIPFAFIGFGPAGTAAVVALGMTGYAICFRQIGCMVLNRSTGEQEQ